MPSRAARHRPSHSRRSPTQPRRAHTAATSPRARSGHPASTREEAAPAATVPPPSASGTPRRHLTTSLPPRAPEAVPPSPAIARRLRRPAVPHRPGDPSGGERSGPAAANAGRASPGGASRRRRGREGGERRQARVPPSARGRRGRSCKSSALVSYLCNCRIEKSRMDFVHVQTSELNRMPNVAQN